MPPIPPNGIQVPAVLSIAGSDPSGGAGIQADLKTFTSIGVYGAAAITSLTTQNTMGVSGITVLPPELVRKQITEVLADLTVSHVKIGMVGSEETAIAIVEALRDFDGEVIYDPVIRSTSGKALCEENTPLTLAEHIVTRATVLTPNIPELAMLSGQSPDDLNLTGTESVTGLFNRFPNLAALALIGGHGQENG
ncbi:MAG: hydroxymethylpyrimidine/phosphomethylpyrimidine kinase, partial [Desulfobulbaceae bacterium]|nr:hydroxymethylpyrimidine/phosphomethylpyrimidine kinase [Desulfobulbaceae bacterium]